MADADVIVRPDEVELDPLSRAQVDAANDRELSRKIEILQGYGARTPEGKRRRLHVRFLVSPVELLGDERGRVKGVRLVRNRLVASESGAINAEATGRVRGAGGGPGFRSVGYRGVGLPDVPFDERKGVIPNDKGRVMDPESSARAGRVCRRLDQARTERRHRHQQAGCGGDRERDGRGP